MIHACFYTIRLVFHYTSWHFYAFFGTNLLTSRHSASSLFSAIFVFQKSYTGNILRIGRNKSRTSRNSPKLPENRRGDGVGSQCVFRKVIGCLGFSHRGVFIGEGAVSEVDPGGLTTGRRGQALGHAPWWWGQPLARLRLLFGPLEALLNIWIFGFCFVQFWEYFLCNFSKTQKQQKTENWHCGISLIG
jgi:hypothetical protein